MAGEAIFIGYRRDDTADVAGRIYDAMAQRFGKTRIFKDVDNIGPGVDFGDYIQTVLPRCRVALILIGPHWLDSEDEDGRRRLNDEHDWVRIEIETALSTAGVLAVPVLVNGARMPRAAEVPESLRPLLRRNAAIIRRDPDFHDDVERLATALRASVSSGTLDLSKLGGERGATQAPREVRERRGPGMAGGAAVGVVLAALAVALMIWAPWRIAPAPSTTTVATTTDTLIAEHSTPTTTTTTAPAQTTTSTTTTPALQPPAHTITPADQTLSPGEMVRVPGGSFMMGEGAAQHQVSVAAFAAGKYDVTFDQYDACSNAGVCSRAGAPSWGRHGNHPVVNVSWNDAQAYVRWLSQRTGQRYRLLTEAEWEYAARAGTTTTYYWGDAASHEYANYGSDNCCSGAVQGKDQWANTSPVGSFAPNRFGLYDMAGNVWQWVQDCYDSSCSNRVLRGGSWDHNPQNVSSAIRGLNHPSARLNLFGFRVARTL